MNIDSGITLNSSEVVLAVAEMAHEQNRLFCEKFMDDNSLVPWAETSDEIKQTAFNGIKSIIENIDVTPEENHEIWRKFKATQGYIYGTRKCDVSKTHPCMVPYADLPKGQKIKDVLFGNLVKTLILSTVPAQ